MKTTEQYRSAAHQNYEEGRRLNAVANLPKEDIAMAYYLLSTAHTQAQQENARLQQYIKFLENDWRAPLWSRLKRVFGRGERWLDVS